MQRQNIASHQFITPQLYVWLMTLTVLICLPNTSQAKTQYPSFADVVRVETVTKDVRKPVNVKRCHWEQLPDRVRYERAHPNQYAHTRRVIERRAKRCRTFTEYQTSKVTTGFNVTLSYQGETFTRHMLRRPGPRVPVSIEISELKPHDNLSAQAY